MTHAELVAVAHESLSLTEAPYLKHYKHGRFREWRGVAFTGSHMPGPGFNFAAVLRPNAPTLDELLPVAQDFFAVADKGWGILVEGDAGHPMEDELRRSGWAIDEDEPAFVMPDISGRALTEADVAAFVAVTMAAFNAPPEFAEMMVPSLAYALDPDLALFVGHVGGADVSAVSYSRSGPTAVIAGTATLEEHRGKGYGAAVVNAALEHAMKRGCTMASLRSGPKSVPLYERVGFRFACRHRTYAYPGAA